MIREQRSEGGRPGYGGQPGYYRGGAGAARPQHRSVEGRGDICPDVRMYHGTVATKVCMVLAQNWGIHSAITTYFVLIFFLFWNLKKY